MSYHTALYSQNQITAHQQMAVHKNKCSFVDIFFSVSMADQSVAILAEALLIAPASLVVYCGDWEMSYGGTNVMRMR